MFGVSFSVFHDFRLLVMCCFALRVIYLLFGVVSSRLIVIVVRSWRFFCRRWLSVVACWLVVVAC